MYSWEYLHILLFIYSHVGINCIIKWIFQRHRCCVFDSPGLPNDSAGYPGLMYVVWGTTPSVLRFLSAIHYKRFHCKRAFTEKAQHLRRWISLRMFTRGRLVPRQPRAIKGTTRTELHHEGIYNVKHMHWVIIIKRAMLRAGNIHYDKYIHWNIGTKPTALRHYNIRNGGCIHWEFTATPMALHLYNIPFCA